MLGLIGYFYLRWQVDITSIPMKSEDAGDAERVAFYRATRDVFLEFSGLVLALFNFTVSYLRGEIASLREQCGLALLSFLVMAYIPFWRSGVHFLAAALTFLF